MLFEIFSAANYEIEQIFKSRLGYFEYLYLSRSTVYFFFFFDKPLPLSKPSFK